MSEGLATDMFRCPIYKGAETRCKSDKGGRPDRQGLLVRRLDAFKVLLVVPVANRTSIENDITGTVAQVVVSHDGWKSRYCMLVCSSLSFSSFLSHSCAATVPGYRGGAHSLFVAGETVQNVQFDMQALLLTRKQGHHQLP